MSIQAEGLNLENEITVDTQVTQETATMTDTQQEEQTTQVAETEDASIVNHKETTSEQPSTEAIGEDVPLKENAIIDEAAETTVAEKSNIALLNETTPTAITENIMISVTLTQADGSELPNPMPHPSEKVLDLKIGYTFELPNNHGYPAGSTYTFTLPDVFKIHNKSGGDLKSGLGVQFGTFEVFEDGTVVMTFNDEIEKGSEIKGTLNIWTEIREDLTGSTNQVVQFPIHDGTTIDFPLFFTPNVKQSIDKRGTPDKKYNANTITWGIDFNKDLKEIQNAQLQDPIQKNQEFVAGSIKIYELDVQLDGSVKVGEEVTTRYGTAFPLNFGTINKAYRVVFQSKITDGEGTTYPNKATLTGDNITDLPATASVGVKRGQPLEKRSTSYDPSTQTITWEIKYNYNEKTISQADAKLTDTLGANQKLKDGTMKVEKVTIDPNTGAEISADVVDNYTSTNNGDDFILWFKEDIENAYKITYQTTAIDRVEKDTTITNTVEANGRTKEATRNIKQQIFHKNRGFVDYKNRTTKWSLDINKDKQVMNNVVITDTLPKGLTLDSNSLVITHGGTSFTKDTDYTLSYTEGTGEMIITFTNPVTDVVRAEYITTFDFNQIEDGETSFTNRAILDWVPKNEVDKKTMTKTSTFTPNNATQLNGSKGGSYNAQTKEITWEVGVNYTERPISDAIVEDIILGNQNFDINTVEVYKMKIDTDGNWIKDGDALNKDKDYIVQAIKGKNDEPGFKLTLGSINRAYVIVYKTDLHDQLIVKNYENTAILKDGATEFPLPATVSIENYGGKYTNKEAAQNKDNPRVLEWKLWINPTQSTVSDAVVIDKPSTNQSILKDSFQLYRTNVDQNGLVEKNESDLLTEGEDYTLSFKEDAEGKEYFELSFKKEVNRPYVLEYDTFIMAGNNQTVSNDASFTGYQITTESTKTNYNHIVKLTGSSGDIDSRIGQLEVTKVDAKTKKPLEGAEFSLFNSTGTIKIKTLTTGADGKVLFQNLLFGEYLLKETKAPTGYVSGVNEAGQMITIDKETKNGESNELTVENKQIIYAVELTKQDKETGEVLANAVFDLQKLVESEYQTIEQVTTNDEGKIYCDGLEPGDYQFVEHTAPKGYQKGKEPIPFTMVENQTEVTKVTAENLKLGSVRLLKYNADDCNEVLENAEFELRHENGDVVHTKLVTDENGEIFVPNLQPGNYQFIEIKAPAYFQLDNTPITFEIIEGQTATVEVEASNILIHGKVLLTKVDKDEESTQLAGAEFKLMDEQGNVIQETLQTDEKGHISVGDLKPGNYTFIETKAPEHYQLNEKEIHFTIDRIKTETEDPVVKVTAKNELVPGSVELIKVDKDNHAFVLQGATFELQNAKGDMLQERLTTNEEGKIVVENLRPGKYQFVETKAPDYYQLNAAPIEFEIMKSQQEKLMVTAENEWITGSVQLTKVDIDNKNAPLSDAVFALQDAEGNNLQEGLTTNKEGKIVVNKLKPGNYQFVETKAPFGYDLDATPIAFTIEKSKTEADVKRVEKTAGNELTRGSVQLIKVDVDNENAPLPDVVFTLQDAEGNNVQEGFTTNEEGKIVVDGLKPGTYQFVETKAPFGYELNNTPIAFTIEKGQEGVKTVTATNELTTGSVELRKVDKDNNGLPLEGAVFALKDSKGKTLKEKLTTNKEGKIVVDGLKPGAYQFVETKAPFGYELDKTPIAFTIEKGQQEVLQLTATNGLAEVRVTVQKVNEDTGEPLEGATFDLYDQNGTKVATITTNQNGKSDVVQLVPGTYTLVETKAPNGYEQLKTPFAFKVEPGEEELMIQVGNKKVLALDNIISNKKETDSKEKIVSKTDDSKQNEKSTFTSTLPQTGEESLRYFLLVGTMLMVIGVYVLMYKKRKTE